VIELFRGQTGQGDLTIVHLTTGEAVSKNLLPQAPFLCGVTLSDPHWSAGWLTAVIRDLIENGAAYLAFYGPRCEEAHDIADHVRDVVSPNEGDDVVMTTWHESESLVDYLWFLAFVAFPTDGYASASSRYCVLDIGRATNPALVSAVREVFVP
jgi:hypothetical protein